MLWLYVCTEAADPHPPTHHLLQIRTLRVNELGMMVEVAGTDDHRFFDWAKVRDVDVYAEEPIALARALTSRYLVKAHKRQAEVQHGTSSAAGDDAGGGGGS